jgi:hypothetical protein
MRSIRGCFWLHDVLRALLSVLALGLLGAGEARAQFSLFDWTYHSPSGTGHGEVSGDMMYILGPDSTSCNGSINSFTAVAPYTMTLVANFDAHNFDEFGAGYDFIVTIVDGVVTVISYDAECAGCETILEVQAGSVFGFGVKSGDCQLGPAEVTLKNLHVEPAGDVVAVSGAEQGELFGSALAGVSDVDGDGAPDVLVGAPLASSGGIESGRVTVKSGRTGAELLAIAGAAPGIHFGAAVSAGDIDGDGLDDYVVGAPLAPDASALGAVRVHSGADASVLWVWTGTSAGDHFGTSVAVAGDVDLDGFNDVLVGAPLSDVPGHADAGTAWLMSGASGSAVTSWHGAGGGDELGYAVDGAGDVNGDGLLDVVVGAPKADGFAVDSGNAYLYSGANGALLHSLIGSLFLETGQFGTSVAGLGDISGDGFADVAVGGPGVDVTKDNGGVWVFSGSDGGLLWIGLGPADLGQLGFAVAAAGDIDGDGQPDAVVGAPHTSSSLVSPSVGTVRAYDGSDGVTLQASTGKLGELYGAAVVGIGDSDLDGLCDLAIGVPKHDGVGTDSGETRLVRSAVLWTNLGSGLSGSLPAPALTGTGLLAGGEVVLALSGAPANAPYFLVVGFSKLAAPFKGGVLVPNPDGLLSFVTKADGGYVLSLAATGPLPAGQSFYLQAWIVDPGGPQGLAASSALRADVP